MKLVEALNTIKKANTLEGEPFACFLATGLNPLHFSTFLAAELSLLFVDRRIQLQQGLYGDLLGNVSRLARADAEAGILLLEWADVDARLGVRSSSAWSPAVCADIVATVKSRASQIQQAIEAASARMPVIVSFPTLPLPPASFAPGWQA